MQKEKNLNLITQIAIPVLTIGGQVVIALKLPQWGLMLALLSQPFWFYSSWKAYKQAGQSGMLVNTVIFSLVTIFGLINYWFL